MKSNREKSLSVLNNVMKRCCEEKVPFFELRPKEKTKEASMYGDYDFFTEKKNLLKVFQFFLENSISSGISFNLTREKPEKWKIFFPCEEKDKGIVLEIWNNIEVSSASKKNKLLRSTLKTKNIDRYISYSKKEPFLDPNIGALIYLTHLFYKEKDFKKGEVQKRIKWFIKTLTLNQGNADKKLGEETINLLKKASKKNIKEVNREALRLLNKISIKKESFVLIICRRIWGKTINIFLFSIGGKMMYILGPDGSGKSFLVKKIVNHSKFKQKKVFVSRFKNFYRRIKLYGLLNYILRKKHKEKRNLVDERLSTFLCFTSLTMLIIFRVIKPFKSLLMDRYFFDYYYKGIRNKKLAVEKTFFAKYFSFLVPIPNHLIVCYCREETRLGRKPGEVESDSAFLLYKTYLQEITRKGIKKSYFIFTEKSDYLYEERVKELINYL